MKKKVNSWSHSTVQDKLSHRETHGAIPRLFLCVTLSCLLWTCSAAIWSTDVLRGYNNGHFNLMQVYAALKSRNLVVFPSVDLCAKGAAETLGILQLQDQFDVDKNWFWLKTNHLFLGHCGGLTLGGSSTPSQPLAHLPTVGLGK